MTYKGTVKEKGRPNTQDLADRRESLQTAWKQAKANSKCGTSSWRSVRRRPLYILFPLHSSFHPLLTSSGQSTTHMETIQQSSILCRFPTEILENIALEVVSVTPLGPPKELIPLLCTCRKVCLTLQSSHFYARIFKIKFDHGAVRRRFGPKSIRSTNMALQLRKYCNNLQDLRRGDIYSSHIHDILRTAFFMATENDGRNACQLEWAGLDKFVDRFVRARLCEDVAQNNGWPAESSINALALWLMWFTTTWG